jgi:peroxiredoxin
MGKMLTAGTRAPEFTHWVTPDQDLSLFDLRGSPIILAFYTADWSPVCAVQMTLYNEIRPEFQKHGAEILGISVDGVWCHQVFAQHNRIHFPLANFELKAGVAKRYGAHREGDGVCKRALFILDRAGVIAWAYLSPIAVNAGDDGILDALANVSNRGEKQ